MGTQILKKLAVMALVLSTIVVVGCNQQGNVDPNELQKLPANVEAWMTQLDMLTAQMELVTAQAQADGILDATDMAKIDQVKVEIDKVKEGITKMAAAVASGTYNPTDDSILTILKAAQAANTATVGFNPYAPYISLALMVIIALLGIFAKKKASEAIAAEIAVDAAELKYQAHKQAVEKTMKEVSLSSDAAVAAVETQLYNNIGDARNSLGVK